MCWLFPIVSYKLLETEFPRGINKVESKSEWMSLNDSFTNMKLCLRTAVLLFYLGRGFWISFFLPYFLTFPYLIFLFAFCFRSPPPAASSLYSFIKAIYSTWTYLLHVCILVPFQLSSLHIDPFTFIHCVFFQRLLLYSLVFMFFFTTDCSATPSALFPEETREQNDTD